MKTPSSLRPLEELGHVVEEPPLVGGIADVPDVRSVRHVHDACAAGVLEQPAVPERFVVRDAADHRRGMLVPDM